MDFAITGKKIKPTQQHKPLTAQKTPKVKSKSSVPPATVPKTVIKKQQMLKASPKIKKTQTKPVSDENPEPPKVQEQRPAAITKITQPPSLAIQKETQEIPHQKDSTQEKESKDDPPITYKVMVRYNHYQEKFPVQNNVLQYRVIQEKYSFSSVFKGNFLPYLKRYKHPDTVPSMIDDPATAMDYSWIVEQDRQYEIFIKEDQQEENKYQRTPYIAPKDSSCPFKKNSRVQDLTNQMKNMSVQELGTEKHKQLLEQRALEQTLYS